MSAEEPAERRRARPGLLLAPVVEDGPVERAGDYLMFARRKDAGMGEVRPGVCLRSGREVMLKSVPVEDDTPELEERLAREAEALRRLAHPGIARILDFGMIGDRPRLVMVQEEGRTLREVMTAGLARNDEDRITKSEGTGAAGRAPRLEMRERVALMRRVAEAMAHAHTQGVVHRDLKPENIMVRSGDGMPVVLDFGIAVFVDATGGRMSDLTRTRMTAGTPKYMALEQAEGKGTHPAAADVYALGVMLFELLTGELPVPGGGEEESAAMYLKRLLETTPRRLREVDPRADRSLEAICERALHREPDKRRSAEDFARQLRLWLEGRPIEWRKFSTRERAALAFKRHPGRWSVAALALVSVVIAALVMGWLAGERAAALEQSRKTEAASLAAVAAGTATRGKVDEAVPDMVRALRLDPGNEVAGWLAGQTLRDRMRMERVPGATFHTDSDDGYYYAVGRGTFYAVRGGDGVLCRGTVSADGTGLEVQPWAAVPPGCNQVVLSKDESRVMVLFTDGALRAYDAWTGSPVWQCESRKASEQTMHGSRSGKLLVQTSVTYAGAATTSRLRVVGTADGRIVYERELPLYTNTWRMAVTHDDRWLVYGAVREEWLGCIDLEQGTIRDFTKELQRMRPGGGRVWKLCPLPDKPRMLLGGQYRGMEVACLDVETGTILWNEPVLGRRRSYTMVVEDLEMVPGHPWFAVTGTEGDVMLHQTADGAPVSGLMACPVHGRAIEFAGEDQLVLSGPRTTIWNWRTGERLTAPLQANLLPVGERLFLAPGKKELRVWRMEGEAAKLHDFKLGEGKAAFDLSADERRGLFAAAGGKAELVDMESLTVLRTLRHSAPSETKPQRMVARPRLSADGSRAVVWEDAQTLAVYDCQEAAAAKRAGIPCGQPVLCAALSPDGKLLSLGLENGIWEGRDAATGNVQRSFSDLCHPPPDHGTNRPGKGMSMEFSPDGCRLAIGTDDWTTVTMWRTADWQMIQPPFMCGHGVRTVRFGADGVLWSGDWLGDCQRFFDPPYQSHPRPGLPTRRPPVARVPGPVTDLALSANGAWMAAGSWNWSARMFDQVTLEPHGPPLEHTGEVTGVDWSPDGKRLLTASASGDVCIWDRATGLQLFSWPQRQPVVQAAFALGGSRIVIARMDGRVMVREVYGGGRLAVDTAERLEHLSGNRVGNEEQFIAVESPK